MHNDDRPIGRILSRREMLALLGTAGVAALVARAARVSNAADTLAATTAQSYLPIIMGPAATAIPTATPTAGTTCVVKPALEEGPFFVDELLNRSDIRSDPTSGVVQQGLSLALQFIVTDINNNCAPLAGAVVDIWNCNALGKYSDESSEGTVGQKWLRGYQATNANGEAQFTTIYPGWYSGRTVHVHVKIRSGISSPTYTFNTQVFFDDAITDVVQAQAPYSGEGTRATRNSNDQVYALGGSQTQLALTQTSQGYAATFHIGLSIT